MDDDEDVPMSQAISDPLMQSRVGFGMTSLDGTWGDKCPRGGRRSKIFNDSVHSHFTLPGLCVEFIDSAPFQRLRELKQLGLSYMVYPSASHNRFEHSLGTSYLASRWARQIYSAQRHELDMSEDDIKVVELAGLCHDLGHGPMSHVFDREFLQRVGVHDWSHEAMSCQMIDLIRDEQHLDHSLTDDEADLIKQLIDKDQRPKGHAPEKAWLFDIVANERNNIDVDKFDYLERDAKCCGVKVSCDFKRLQMFSMVKENQICFKNTEAINVRELFHSREIMHRSVYTHRKAKSIEFMMVDVLVEANELLGLSSKIHRAADFLQLDDTIFKQIEHYGKLLPSVVDDGGDQRLKTAQALIRRLRNRQLYRFVNELVVPPELVWADRWTAPTAEDIVARYSKGDVKLSVDDVIVSENKIDFTMKDGNPLDHVLWFDQFHEPSVFRMSKRQISSMMPEAFQERTLRVYSRKSDPATVAAIGEAFENWQQSRFGGAVVAATPRKVQKEAFQRPTLSNSYDVDGSQCNGSQGSAQHHSRKRRLLTSPPGGSPIREVMGEGV